MNTISYKPASVRSVFLRAVLASWLLVACGAVNAMEMQSVDTGEQLKLEDLTGQGKWTLVMFWATDCHICKLQKPDMSAFHEKYKNSKAEVIGVALDGPEEMDAIRQYIKETKPSFPSYVSDGIIISSYYYSVTEDTLRGTPTYLLFSPEGELLGNNPGMLSVEAIENFIARKS